MKLRLSELVGEIESTLQNKFSGEIIWITAEVTDVKKQPDKRWCFLKFIEKDGALITTEIRGVFWATTFHTLEKFESLTRQTFSNGLEITCAVRVRFHRRFGLNLEVLEIDHSYALGKLDLEKQETLDRLVKENPEVVQFMDGQYITRNSKIKLPVVLQRIALVTAPDSDGQRDFKQEIENNRYGYAFFVSEFLTQIQGDSASKLLMHQLRLIEAQKERFDVVALVRGGGSQTDFKPFDNYDLALFVASFPLPIFTGIGHDRNTSIVDQMARQHKTPTKVATSIVDHTYSFEAGILDLKDRLFNGATSLIEEANLNLKHIRRTVKAYSPSTILNKGYAMIISGDKIVVDPKALRPGLEIKTVLKNELIHSTITKKTINELDL